MIDILNLVISGAFGAVVATALTLFFNHVAMKKNQTVKLFEEYQSREFVLDRFKLETVLDSAIRTGNGSTMTGVDVFIMQYYPTSEEDQLKCRRALATVLSFLEKSAQLCRNERLHNAMFRDLLGDETRRWLESFEDIFANEPTASPWYKQLQRVKSLHLIV